MHGKAVLGGEQPRLILTTAIRDAINDAIRDAIRDATWQEKSAGNGVTGTRTELGNNKN